MAPDAGSEMVYQRWLADFAVLRVDVLTISLRKNIFDDLDAEMCRVNASVAGGALDQFLRPMYAEAQAVLVRRLADNDKRSTSLHNLVTEMINHPQVLSRERHLREVRERWIESGFSGTDADADELFDDLAGAGQPFVPPVILMALRKQIVDDAEVVTKHVNKYVAHRDRQRPPAVTWGELNRALASAAEHYSTIGRLLTGAAPSGDLVVTPEWQAAFCDLFPGMQRMRRINESA